LFETTFIQKELKDKLSLAIEQERIPHAIFLKGAEGSGNLPIAIALANEILNIGKVKGFFGETEKDNRALHLNHPDLQMVFPVQQESGKSKKCSADYYFNEFRNFYLENNYITFNDWAKHIGHSDKNPIISTVEAQNIIKKLSLKSFEGGHQVMIIWQPQKMNLECANKLLKIIEEPEPKKVIIMVGSQWEQLLQTIRSRVQLIRIKPFSKSEISHWLKTVFEVEEERAELIAEKAMGIPKDAIALCGHQEDHSISDALNFWLKACAAYNHLGLIDFSDKYHAFNKIEKRRFLDGIAHKLNQALREDKLHIKQVSLIHKNVEEAIYALSRNAHPKTLILNLSLNTCKIINTNFNA